MGGKCSQIRRVKATHCGEFQASLGSIARGYLKEFILKIPLETLVKATLTC